MSDENPNAWLETCDLAARAGGRELLSWQGRFQTREKGVCDLVTDADLASQRAIQAVISERHPDHAFLGEEQSAKKLAQPSDRLTWVVDPLDGTTNYVHGYPNYSVSVALTRNGELLAGIVYDPLRDEVFAAAAGQGATFNGVPIKTSTTTSIADSLVAVSLPPRVQRNSPDLLDFIEIVERCQAIRRSGSTALNLARVASGALDGFWATHIHPWDVAAGVLLIREAGGIVTGRDGAKFDLWNPHFVSAAGQQLHHELMGALTPFPRNK